MSSTAFAAGSVRALPNTLRISSRRRRCETPSPAAGPSSGPSARKDLMRPLVKLLLPTLAAGLTVATGIVSAQTQTELPEIGNPAGAMISVNEERQIREMIVRK